LNPSSSSKTTEISVVLPFRDASEFLEEALFSLQAQDWTDFEAVLVDDASIDGSADLARRFAAADKRFRIVPSAGEGIAAALNTGLRSARGRWVARLDADDVCHPARLSKQLELARCLDPLCVIGCLVRCTGSAGEGWRTYEKWINSLVSPEEIERSIFIESPMAHPTVLFDREAVLAEGAYREGDFPEDYELWLRLWARGFSFRKVPEVLLDWRDSEQRLSRTSPKCCPGAFLATKAAFLKYAPAIKGHDKVIVWGAGRAGKNLTDCLRTNGLDVEAFVDVAPRRIGGSARGRPVISPGDLHGLRSETGNPPVLTAVRSRGARDTVKRSLEGLGLSDWVDFVLCS
jgi:hypothetical protein